MNTNPCGSKCNAFFGPALPISLRILVERQGTCDGSVRLIRLLTRRSEQHMQGITNNLGDSAIMANTMSVMPSR